MYSISALQSYVKVNEIFAAKTIEAIRTTDRDRRQRGEDTAANPPIVWIHDYHLMLAANTIRSVLMVSAAACGDSGPELTCYP